MVVAGGWGGGEVWLFTSSDWSSKGRLPTMTMRNPKSYESNKMQRIIIILGEDKIVVGLVAPTGRKYMNIISGNTQAGSECH